jgi:hypothetical protein
MIGLEAAMFVTEMMLLVAAGLTMINPGDKPVDGISHSPIGAIKPTSGIQRTTSMYHSCGMNVAK